MDVQADIQVVARVNFDSGELAVTTDSLRLVLENARRGSESKPVGKAVTRSTAASENQTQRLLEALAEAQEKAERLQRHLQDTGAYPLPSEGW